MASLVEFAALSETARGVWQDDSGQKDDDAGHSSNAQAEPPAPRMNVLSAQVDEACITLGLHMSGSQAVASRHAKDRRK